MEKVEEVINGKFDEKIKSEIKELIKSLCTTAPGISLTEFEEKFNYEDYNDVLKLLIEKRSSIEKSQNQEKN